MTYDKLKELLVRFLTASEAAVIDLFAALPGAVVSKKGDYVFLQGRRKDRILLVAHADTVSNDVPDVVWIGDVAMRADSSFHHNGKGDPFDTGAIGYQWRGGVALGGDDRAGCALMYHLYDGQHSLLVTTGEERGCVGSRAALSEIKNLLRKHQFAIQVDRRGNRQAVFYDVYTKPFEEFVLRTATAADPDKRPWQKHDGSSTDIRVLCNELDICGVNFSAGFWGEHSRDEMLFFGAWLNTRAIVKEFMQLPKVEKYELPRRQYSEFLDHCFVCHAAVGSEHRPFCSIRKEHAWVWAADIKPPLDDGKASSSDGLSKPFLFVPKIITDPIRLYFGPSAISKNAKKRLFKEIGQHISKKLMSGDEGSALYRKITERMAEKQDDSITYVMKRVQNEPPAARAACRGCGYVYLTQASFDQSFACPVCHQNPRQAAPLKSDEDYWLGSQWERRSPPRCEHGVLTTVSCGACTQAKEQSKVVQPGVQVMGGSEIRCYHYCLVCKSPHGSWSHRKAQSGGCELIHQSLCPDHSVAVAAKASRMEAEAANLDVRREVAKAEPHIALPLTGDVPLLLPGSTPCDDN